MLGGDGMGVCVMGCKVLRKRGVRLQGFAMVE